MLSATEIRISERLETMNTLIEQVNSGEIDMSYNFNPWTDTVKSHLIESLLIRIPLQSFYIDYTQDTLKIIDGYKRLATITEFVNDKFALCDLEYLPKYNGAIFSKWKTGFEQRRITETQVQVFYVDRGTGKDELINLYDRIRTVG